MSDEVKDGQPVPASRTQGESWVRDAQSPLDAGDLPPLSDHGRPRSCPACGGASVYARFLAMEGRACRYASKGDKIIAFYCGEHERKREAFDVDLVNDLQGSDIGGWNSEVLDAVRGMSRHVLRDVENLRALAGRALGGMMAHIRELETELAGKTKALAESRAAEQKLLAAVPKRRRKARK